MRKTLKTLASALLVTSSLSAMNIALADDIQLGMPGYGGTGCPAGTVSATLSPDNKSLSLIFDQFQVSAGRSVGKSLDRKNCQVAIPIHVPQGLSVSIIDVDYRGFVSLPKAGQARFSAEYFFAGMVGPKFERSWLGSIDTDYTFTNTLGVQAVVWSPCGADTNLRVSSSMLVKSNSRGEDAQATVDSADFRSGIVYKLQWRSCSR